MNGVERIAAERRRQIEAEGWTPEHDDQHAEGELARAAASYCLAALPNQILKRITWVIWRVWPKKTWDYGWFKPSSDDIRNLEKAGALIAAEIDRQLRLRERAAAKGECLG